MAAWYVNQKVVNVVRREPESTLSFATCQADKISQAQQYQMHNLGESNQQH